MARGLAQVDPTLEQCLPRRGKAVGQFQGDGQLEVRSSTADPQPDRDLVGRELADPGARLVCGARAGPATGELSNHINLLRLRPCDQTLPACSGFEQLVARQRGRVVSVESPGEGRARQTVARLRVSDRVLMPAQGNRRRSGRTRRRRVQTRSRPRAGRNRALRNIGWPRRQDRVHAGQRRRVAVVQWHLWHAIRFEHVFIVPEASDTDGRPFPG
jgi:hypothetical protein